MEGFIKGDIVVLPFPFSDLSTNKKRPAFVLCNLSGDDIILCQITSQDIKDNYSIQISSSDFSFGNLKKEKCNLRPNKIFTADKKIIEKKIGALNKQKINEIINKIIEILKK